ncbi:MAG TPA: class I SAM-dependent methyltransferase [Candidatus Binataceae bacterium]|nr:class I SAM-dependent methyltransferase [Candidatus Binataceae bacterium]
MAENSPAVARPDTSFWLWLDRHIGRGSYYWLRDNLHPAQQYPQLIYAQLIEDRISPTTRWLDAGGGHQVLEVTAPDRELEMVRRAKFAVCCDLDGDGLKRHRSIPNRVTASLEALPFGAKKFDLITSNSVVEHLEHPETVLSEMARVLAPGGTAIVHTPNSRSYAVRIAGIGRKILPERLVVALIRYLDFREEEDTFPTYYRANSEQALTDTAAKAGLSCERVLLLPARPLFYFFAPLCALELIASRMLIRLGARGFAASVIVGIYRKPIS